MSDLASLITAIAALVTSIAILVSTLLNNRQIKAVHAEVKTGNSQTLAQLADATETRRIDKIDKGDRTEQENSHQAVLKRETVFKHKPKPVSDIR